MLQDKVQVLDLGPPGLQRLYHGGKEVEAVNYRIASSAGLLMALVMCSF